MNSYSGYTFAQDRVELLNPINMFTSDLEVAGYRIREIQYAPGLEISAHSHATPLWGVVVRGSLTELCAGRREYCGARTVRALPPGWTHANLVGTRGAICMIVEVSVSAGATLDGPRKRAQHFCAGRLPLLATRLHEAVSSRLTPERANTEFLLAEMAAALANTTSNTSKATKRPHEQNTTPPAWLRTACDRLHDEFRHPPTCAALALGAGVHPVHFTRTFQRFCGMTPRQYIRALRVAWVAAEFARSRTAIAEIALAAGFADQSHLTRDFKRETGVPPAQYRQRLLMFRKTLDRE